MKTIRVLFAAVLVGTTALARATDFRVTKLDGLVSLTSEQKTKAEAIFRQEDTALAEARSDPSHVPMFRIVETAVANLRALLTPDQLAIYDRTPQDRGGGVMAASPEERLRELDHEVGLSSAQKPIALQVFTEEYQSILALPWDQRDTVGVKYRQTAQDEIRAMLTPAQIEKQDNTRNTMMARATEELDATEKAVRASRSLAAKIGDIMYLVRSRRTSRMDASGRRGEARFDVTGTNKSEAVVVSWERIPATAPVKVTKIAGADGEVFGP